MTSWRAKATEAFVLGWSSDNGQSDNILTPLFHSKSPLNFFKYENPSVDKYLAAAQTELDENKKAELYREICDVLLKDPPAAFLPTPTSYRALDERLKGITLISLTLNSFTLCVTEALKGYNMKIMAEYVIKEIDFET